MSYSKQQVDENTDYKAGHAISLEDRMISVKYDSTLCLNSEGALSVVNSGSSGGSSDDYIAGKGIQINNNAINANVDGSTIKVNDKNQLEVINGGGGGDGKEYKAGKALNLNTDATFDVKVDDSTIKVNDKNELTVPQPTIPSYSAGQALSLDANNKFDVNVDGTTIKVNGNQLTVPQPTIPTYTAGQALSLDANNKFDVNVDGTTIKVNGNQLTVPQPTIPTYTAGQALTLDSNNKFDVNVDGTTIKLNEQNQLTAINEGKTYTAGDGIEIEATTIKARIDGTTIKCENGVLNVPQPTIPTYTAGQALTLDDSHKFNVSIDGSTIKVNDKNQLEAINGGGSSYKAGDGISINNDTISVNQNWFDIRDSINNPDGTFQFQNISKDASKQDIKLCCIEARYPKATREFFTQSLGLNPDYELDFNTSINQESVSSNEASINDETSYYLLTITDIPNDLHLSSNTEVDFLNIHLPDYIKDQHGKPIETVTCKVKNTDNGYICDIESSGTNENSNLEFINVNEVIPSDLVSFSDVGCDFDIKHIVNLTDQSILQNEGSEVRICDKDKRALAIFISDGAGKFAIHGSDLPSDSLDLPNSIFHYNHELHKELFKNVVKIEFSIAADSYAYKTYSFNNFHIELGSPKYIIPFIHETLAVPTGSMDNALGLKNLDPSDDRTYYTIEYLDDNVKPGIMSSSSLNLKEMLLRGELMIDIIYDKTNIKTENVIRCKELIADNGFTLHKSPLIFIYEPNDFGEEIINGIKHWYIDFGYDIESDEFKALPVDQPFEFIDNKVFGLHYCFTKKLAYTAEDESHYSWQGKNIYYHAKEDVRILEKYQNKQLFHTAIVISKCDELKLVLQKRFGMVKDIEGSVVEFLRDHMKITFISNKSGKELDYFE
ncbi:hypothetical protein M9Y10_020573 [Tritrichomonas musculus]|uniref:Uncharacterized protein n=1 Tax=Tritrichomonas musculus TaxID=1915356 RepID=A0ABR2HF37_9EUKA